MVVNAEDKELAYALADRIELVEHYIRFRLKEKIQNEDLKVIIDEALEKIIEAKNMIDLATFVVEE